MVNRMGQIQCMHFVGIGGIEKPSQIKELHKLKVKGAAVLRACEETKKFNSLVEAWLTG